MEGAAPATGRRGADSRGEARRREAASGEEGAREKGSGKERRRALVVKERDRRGDWSWAEQERDEAKRFRTDVELAGVDRASRRDGEARGMALRSTSTGNIGGQ